MPSIERVLEFRQQVYNESVALIRQKGHDYNRQQQDSGDTLFNLRVAELLGIVQSAERGILVRLSDKFMRLISLMAPGVDAAVKGESVRDTVRDIHNYIDYALLLWEERQYSEPATGSTNDDWITLGRRGGKTAVAIKTAADVYVEGEKLKDGSSPPPPSHINVSSNKMGPGYIREDLH